MELEIPACAIVVKIGIFHWNFVCFRYVYVLMYCVMMQNKFITLDWITKVWNTLLYREGQSSLVGSLLLPAHPPQEKVLRRSLFPYFKVKRGPPTLFLYTKLYLCLRLPALLVRPRSKNLTLSLEISFFTIHQVLISYFSSFETQ